MKAVDDSGNPTKALLSSPQRNATGVEHEELLAKYRKLKAIASRQEEEIKNIRVLLDHTTESFCLLDSNYTVISFNQTHNKVMEDGVGMTLQAGANYLDYVLPSEQDHFRSLFEQALAGETVTGLKKIDVGPGQSVQFEYTFTPVLDEDSNETRVSFRARDITAEEMSKQSLADEVKWTDLILDITDVGICVTDVQGNFVKINKTYCDIYGYTEDELVGQHFTKVVEPQLRKTFIELYNQNLEVSETCEHGELKGLRKDGSLIEIKAAGRAFKFDDGNTFKITTVADVTATKETENLVLESEEKFRKIFEDGPLAMAIVDLDGRYQTVNSKMCELVGYSEEELLQYGIADITHPEDLQKDQYESERVFRGEIPLFQLEKRFIRKDGVIVHGKLTATVIRDDEGSPIYGLGMIEDITEQKITSQKLQESEQWFKAIFDNSRDGILIEEEEKIIFVNDALVRLYGYESADELLGQHLSTIQADESNEKLLGYGKQRKEGEEVPDLYEARGRRSDGSIFDVEVSASLFQINNSKYIISIERDITDRKSTEERLIESQEWLQTAFNASRDGVLVEKDEKIFFVNNALVQLFGYDSQDQLIGNTLEMLTTQDFGKKAMEFGRRRLLGENVPAFYEFIGRKKDGSTFDLEISVSVFKTKDETFIISSLRDVTERKTAERSLTEKNEELSKINSELDSFVYSTSHDLRAPLVSILGLINLVKVETKEAERSLYYELMEKSIKKLDSFVKDIIDYSRNSRLDNQIDEIEFDLLLQECFEELQYIKGAADISKQTKVREKVGFHTDRNRLKMILSNIISNAIRYSDPDKKEQYLKINISSDRSEAKIVITDNGIGIDKEYLPKIFEMFYRASETNVGSGLGLYIVKEGVNKLNGTIKAKSTLGKGTTFEIRIPNLSR